MLVFKFSEMDFFCFVLHLDLDSPGNLETMHRQEGEVLPSGFSPHSDSPEQKMTHAQFLHARPEQRPQPVVPSVMRVPFAPAHSGLSHSLSPRLKLPQFYNHPQGQRGRVGSGGLGCCPLGWRTISQVLASHWALSSSQ